MRVRDRRKGERRESPRVPMAFLIRDATEEEAPWALGEGNLSLGGFQWRGKPPPKGKVLDVRFRLPRFRREIRAKGEVIRVTGENGSSRFHIRFTELELKSEMAIARFLDEVFYNKKRP
ncbi:MAG TPA: PilZ domain-containing protein [Myxococcaceae bacterium]|jgi:hypothetical protein|nr:PilZ domain-containing protein [Myxococcaceae bacterium]